MICETAKASEGKAEVRLRVLNLHLEFSDEMNGQNLPCPYPDFYLSSWTKKDEALLWTIQ